MLKDLNLLAPKIEPKEKTLTRRVYLLSALLFLLNVCLVGRCVLLVLERRALEQELAYQEKTLEQTRRALADLSGRRPTYEELQKVAESLVDLPLDPSAPARTVSTVMEAVPREVLLVSTKVSRDAEGNRILLTISGETGSPENVREYLENLASSLDPAEVGLVSLDRISQGSSRGKYRFTVQLILEPWR